MSLDTELFKLHLVADFFFFHLVNSFAFTQWLGLGTENYFDVCQKKIVIWVKTKQETSGLKMKPAPKCQNCISLWDWLQKQVSPGMLMFWLLGMVDSYSFFFFKTYSSIIYDKA